MGRLGQAVLDAVLGTYTVKTVTARQQLLRLCCKPYTIVGQQFMHLKGQLFQYPSQKFGRQHARGTRVQFRKGHLAGAVDGDEQLAFAFFRADFGKIDVQVANGVVVELLFLRGRTVFVRQGQAADALTLKTAV